MSEQTGGVIDLDLLSRLKQNAMDLQGEAELLLKNGKASRAVFLSLTSTEQILNYDRISRGNKIIRDHKKNMIMLKVIKNVIADLVNDPDITAIEKKAIKSLVGSMNVDHIRGLLLYSDEPGEGSRMIHRVLTKCSDHVVQLGRITLNVYLEKKYSSETDK